MSDPEVRWSRTRSDINMKNKTLSDLQLWDASSLSKVRSMGGHSCRVGSLAWNTHILTRYVLIFLTGVQYPSGWHDLLTSIRLGCREMSRKVVMSRNVEKCRVLRISDGLSRKVE